MKKILAYLTKYLAQNFDTKLYLSLTALLAIGIYLKYGQEINPYFPDDQHKILKGFIFYCIPYFGSLILISLTKKQFNFWRKPQFWLLNLAILFVLVSNQYLLIYEPLLKQQHRAIYSFLSKISFNLFTGFVYAFIPFIYYIFNQKQESWYGLTLKNFDYRPYSFMLLLMFPLLIWASFQPSFLKIYPRYVPSSAEYYWEISNWITITSYELSYILQFIFLELFFRGFMLTELQKYIKDLAVLPMTCVYAYIHFGKPLPETLGSIFGGFILGVIAIRSKSIFGGICIHVGIALIMELLAYLQLYF